MENEDVGRLRTWISRQSCTYVVARLRANALIQRAA
jgi:hypothetical protein